MADAASLPEILIVYTAADLSSRPNPFPVVKLREKIANELLPSAGSLATIKGPYYVSQKRGCPRELKQQSEEADRDHLPGAVYHWENDLLS
jgi:hypothetical protein